MNEKLWADINNINQLFSNQFTSLYVKSKIKDKDKLVKFFSHFYRHWYHSALIENTILSPANLVNTITREDGRKSVTAPNVNLEYKSSSFIDISFSEVDYSLDSHPIVEDLKIFLGLISPDIALTETGFFPPELENEILSRVSIKDTFYVEYLFLICVNLELIKKLPSIHVSKVQVTKKAAAFFNCAVREVLSAVIEETVELCVVFLKNISPFHELPLDREFIMSILRKPISTEEIFRFIYSSAGVDFDSALSISKEMESQLRAGVIPGADDLEQLFMASSFLLGTLLDKYFFTPFGYYLKLIQPLYIQPFDFEYAIEALDLKKSEDVIPALFTPCSAFSLTPLGMDYFGVYIKPGDNHLIDSSVPNHLLIKLALSKASNKVPDNETLMEISRFYDEQPLEVYELKIVYLDDKSYWKRIRVMGDFTLQELHFFLCDEFNLEPSPTYCFFADMNKSLFGRYAPPEATGHNGRPLKPLKGGAARFKNTADTKLGGMGLTAGHKFLYVVQNVLDPFSFGDFSFQDISFLLEVMKIKKPTGIEYYPQVLRESQAFRDLDDMFDMDL